MLKSQGLFVGDKGLDLFRSQEVEGRHDRLGPGETGIREMGEMPVIGPFSSLLRQIGPRPLGSEQMGLVGHVIPGACDALRPVVPVDVPDKLRVAVGAPVVDVDLPSCLLQCRPRAEYVGGLVADRGPGKDDGDEEHGPEDDEPADNDEGDGHSHSSSSRFSHARCNRLIQIL